MTLHLLLDGPRNGDYVTADEGFEAGYVFDAPTQQAWADVDGGSVMVHESVAREYEADRVAELAEALL